MVRKKSKEYKKPVRSDRDLSIINNIIAECSGDINELQFIINRYCGPHNEILSYKKFGLVLHPSDFENAIAYKMFDDLLSE